nr:MAG TPA: hypothetical protein [Crassvirales sp.]
MSITALLRLRCLLIICFIQTARFKARHATQTVW